jgi:hypothetical protein
VATEQKSLELDATEDELWDRYRCILSGHCTVGAHDPSIRYTGGDPGSSTSRYRIDAEPDWRKFRDCRHRGRQARAVNDANVSAAMIEFLKYLIPPHNIDGAKVSFSGEHYNKFADGRVRHILDDPILRPEFSHDITEQQHGGRRIDADHRGLTQVGIAGQNDYTVCLDPTSLRPILSIEIDDEMTRFDAGYRFANRNHASDPFSSRGGRKLRLQPIASLTKGNVSGIDRNGQNIEYNFVGGRPTHVGTFDTFGDIFGLAELCDLHLFHCEPPRTRCIP